MLRRDNRTGKDRKFLGFCRDAPKGRFMGDDIGNFRNWKVSNSSQSFIPLTEITCNLHSFIEYSSQEPSENCAIVRSGMLWESDS